MAALKASLERSRGRGGGNSGGPSGDGRAGLERLSREQLYERAKEQDIPGRSDMSKEELVDALAGAAA